ncbi:monovalent cation/H(+) antiporter subunit G [uncultured Sphaerochaeta sp.]|uniref:cation:proton antiporter n=1 Tax=uncultured Sphaerochaeta sp. TaxID=886478 RepID=UPI002A0A78CB|nr:monovalent cation/H(+) antiporter subunit G [uncultured Sphaerochaeta sp.]
MTVQEIIALLFFVLAIIFGLGGILGMFRFKDPFSGMQAGSLCGTTSVLCIFFGCLALADSFALVARVLILITFFWISAPTGTSIVARFVWDYFAPEEKKNKQLTKPGNKENR